MDRLRIVSRVSGRFAITLILLAFSRMCVDTTSQPSSPHSLRSVSNSSAGTSLKNPRVAAALKLIAVDDYRANTALNLVMDANKSRAVAFIIDHEKPKVEPLEE
jgi:hypothetical protein